MIEDIKTRQCPECKEQIIYKSKYECARAIQKNSVCSQCRYKKTAIRNKQNAILSEKDKIEILELIKQDFSYKEIKEKFNTTSATVCRIARANGIIFKSSPQKIIMIDENHAKCSKCKKIFEIEKFKINRNGLSISYCRDCYNKQSNAAINKNINRFFKIKTKGLKQRCIKNSIPFDLDTKFLLNLFENQNKKCFYTDELMSIELGKGKQRNQLSVDRIIPEKGYVKGNVVFCLFIVNNSKTDLTLEELEKWIPQWYNRIQEFLKGQNNVNGNSG